MSADFWKEKISFAEPGVVIGEVTYNLTGTRVAKTVWNGKTHTILIGETKLIFVPDDEDGESRTRLVEKVQDFATDLLGLHGMGRTSRAFMAREGFDIFGCRQISFRYFLVSLEDQNTTAIDDCIVSHALVRRRYGDDVNDFLDLPEAQIALKFKSHEKALAFVHAVYLAKEAWSS